MEYAGRKYTKRMTGLAKLHTMTDTYNYTTCNELEYHHCYNSIFFCEYVMMHVM
jgi:hypothetical protein